MTREAQQAAADTAPMGFHYITGGAGNSCFLVLGVPNAREGKTKQKKRAYSELCSNIQVTTLLLSSPHPRPHTRTCTPRRACLPANTEELPISSQFWLSFKGKRPKRNPESSVAQPHPCHGARPHRAACRLEKESLFARWEGAQWVS